VETLKTVLKYAALPFVVLGAIIYGLLMKVSSLKGQAAIKDAEKEIADVITKKEAASRDADAAVADFRDALERERSDDT
jgi:F0F1-type ATP synthase membrane subunit b/b'